MKQVFRLQFIFLNLCFCYSLALKAQTLNFFLGFNSKQIYESGLPLTLKDEFNPGLGVNIGLAYQRTYKKFQNCVELYGTWGHAKLTTWKGVSGLGRILGIIEPPNKYLLHGVGLAINAQYHLNEIIFIGPRFGIEYRGKYINSSLNFKSPSFYYHLGLLIGVDFHNVSIYGIGKADLNPFYKSYTIDHAYTYKAYSAEWSIILAYRILQ